MLTAGESHTCTGLFSVGLADCGGLSTGPMGTAGHFGEHGSVGPVTCVRLPIPTHAVG